MPRARRFEYSEGTSNKFWEVWTEASEVVTRFGKLGSSGQGSRRSEKSAEAAALLRDKLVREKLAKGYVDAKASATPTRATSKSKAPRLPTRATTRAPSGTAHPLVALGTVGSGGDSAAVSVLFVDAARLGGWTRGRPADGGGEEVAVGRGRGVLLAVGTNQSCDVYRFGDALVLGDAALDDDDDDATRAFERALVGTATKKPRKIGTVSVESGVLALHAPTHRPARAVPKAALAEATRNGACAKEGLVLVKLPKGRYDLWMEDLRRDASWGTLESRLRIVGAETNVVVGAPLGSILRSPVAAAPKVSVVAPARVRTFVVPDAKRWVAVGAMAVAPDGRAFAAQNGEPRICAFAQDGSVAWDRTLDAKTGTKTPLALTLAGDELLALEHASLRPRVPTHLHVLDARTGKTKHAFPFPDAHALTATHDGKVLVVRHDSPEGTVLRVLQDPRSAPVWQATEDSAGYMAIAVSPDGKWAALAGYQLQVHDLATRERLAWTRALPLAAPDDDAPEALAFVPNGRLVVGSRSLLRLYDTRSGKVLAKADPAPGKKRKPDLCAVAASNTHVAAVRADGTVIVYDATLSKVVREIGGLHNLVPGKSTDEWSELAAVAFDASGALWISACPKKASVGLSRYEL